MNDTATVHHRDSAPWAWRLDSATGSSATLGPSLASSSSASLVDPFSTCSSQEELHWRTFTHSQPRRKKRRKLNFSSDESDHDSEDTGSASGTKVVVGTSDGVTVSELESEAHGVLESAVYKDNGATSNEQHQSPLTLKETQRLCRLISIVFRYGPLEENHALAPVSLTQNPDKYTTCESDAVSTSKVKLEHGIQLKDKYLPKHSAASSRQAARLVSKILPEDADASSLAASKLRALISTSLPRRTTDFAKDWITQIATQSLKDRRGNILLPDSAYVDQEPTEHAHVGIETETTGSSSNSHGRKLTRAALRESGAEAPPIPLPGFWRRRAAATAGKQTIKTESDSDGMASSDSSDVKPGATDVVGASSTAATDESTPAPASSTDESLGENTTAIREKSAERDRDLSSSAAPCFIQLENLSVVLAARNEEKRQAQILLLRTHKRLRKPKVKSASLSPPAAVDNDLPPAPGLTERGAQDSSALTHEDSEAELDSLLTAVSGDTADLESICNSKQAQLSQPSRQRRSSRSRDPVNYANWDRYEGVDFEDRLAARLHRE
ncbi:hypothetical protein BCV70DRAFT_196937 [Testicularia cyperi]|uniref:Uncharacterized protein n=1 Tax=Testicularia cyperi TaxID=1882483 RepID=A0A317XZH6_9BASI|nr:hypothetical protein BCV70DRAFT_196937 [Testicularia cyperi]